MKKHLKSGKKLRKQIVSVVLVVAIIITGLNFEMMSDSIYAAKEETVTEQEKQNSPKEVQVVRELIGERTENTNTYLMSDGSKKLEMYGKNIRYKEKGMWEDYDSTLKELTVSDKNRLEKICRNIKADKDKYSYVNSRGDSYQYFAEKFDEDHPIVMNKNGHTIRFAPAEQIADNSATTEGGTEEKSGVEVLKKTYSNEADKIVYADKEQKTEYAYTSLNNGVKEEIILNEKPERNVFEFKYNIPGMEAIECDGNIIVLADKETGEAAAVISAPYVTDVEGNISYDDVHMETEKTEKDTYILKVIVDEEYLKDEGRYPVTIDPTVYWNCNNINSSDDNPNNRKGIPGTYRFYTGIDDEGYERVAYLGCTSIINQVKGKNIKVAAFKPMICNIEGNPIIKVKNTEETCDFMTLYKGGRPRVGAKTYYTYDCAENKSGDRIYLDLTRIVREIAVENLPSYGIALKTEGLQAGNYADFYGDAETDKEPIFYIDYSETTDADAVYDGSLSISGEYEGEGNIQLNWEAYDNTDVYQIYARENEGDFAPVGISEGEAYTYTLSENTEQVDFRVLAVRKNEEGIVNGEDDILSNIISFEKKEDMVTNDDGTEVTDVSYALRTFDTDGDGLEDGYEIWDFKTLWNTVERYDNEGKPVYKQDSDGDGFSDSYEVFTLGTDPAVKNEEGKDSDGDGWSDLTEYQKGTDPWLYDSDFDGLRDKDDAGDNNPRKTDNPRVNGTDKSAASAAQVHKGLYDREYSETENDVTVTYVVNIYRGDIKSIYNNYGNAKLNKRLKYFYDADGNNTAIVEQYDDNDTQTICITYTYDDYGNVEFICDQQTKYTMEYNSDNKITNLQVGGKALVSYEYNSTVNNPEEETSGVESSSETDSTSAIKSQNEQITYYGSGDDRQKVKTVTTEYKVEEDNKTAVAEKVEMFYDDETTPSYITTVNVEGQIITLTDNTEDRQSTYSYEYTDNLTKITRSDGFIKEVTQDIDEDNNKSTLESRYTYKSLTDEEKTRVSKVETDASDSEKIKSMVTLYNDDVINEVLSNDGKSDITSLYSNTYKKNIVKYSSVEESATHRIFDIAKYGEDKNIDYTYDKAGNITKIKIDGTLTYAYEYDAHERLTWEYDYDTSRAYEYGYTTTGNVEAKHTYDISDAEHPVEFDDEIKTYTYKNADWPDQLTKYCGNIITYDSSGNPKEYYNGISFDWYRGRQLKDATLENGNKISYKYNEDGLRTYKDTTKTTSEYEWDDSKLLRETVTYKQTGKKYDIWYMYDANDSVVGFEYSQINEMDGKLKTTRIYYEKNLQGDVIGLLDSRGAEIAVYAYDAWGNIITDNGASFCYEGYEVPFELNHILYRGYYYDGSCNDAESDTNLYYLQSRYYDPEIGRFINADDVSVLGIESNSVFKDNLYCYCNGDPVNNIDPTGKWFLRAIIAATSGAVFGALAYAIGKKVGLNGKKLTAFTATFVAFGVAVGMIWGVSIINAINKALKPVLYFFKSNGVYLGIKVMSRVQFEIHTAHHGKPIHFVVRWFTNGRNYFKEWWLGK